MPQETTNTGEALERRVADAGSPGTPTALGGASGSPFVVGRPLRASEPIFGRDELFPAIARQLAKFSSVNVVGERRIGKTSFLNHLIHHQDQHLITQPAEPPLMLACIDLQAGVSRAGRFYGVALRELLDHLSPDQDAEAYGLHDLRQRLRAEPEAEYHELERVLRHLRDPGHKCTRPVLIVDEFERLLEPAASEGFPYPDFFNGLRALITADLLAMVILSCRSLGEYFRDPNRPGGLTSTFPTYFTLFHLRALDDEAADALLLQPSDHTLTLEQVAWAKRRAGGHPCHLQVAGQAWYDARVGQRTARWTRRRFTELRDQNCMVRDGPDKRSAWLRRLRRAFRFIVWGLPIRIGRLARRLGARLSDLAAWIVGTTLILMILLLLLGVAKGPDVLDFIKKLWGLR